MSEKVNFAECLCCQKVFQLSNVQYEFLVVEEKFQQGYKAICIDCTSNISKKEFEECIEEVKSEYTPHSMKCEYCGRDNSPETPVTYMCDPFDAEIKEDFTKHWLCDKCIYEREQDI